MLTGYKKKLVKEVISYYIDTTGLSADTFILYVQRNFTKERSTLGYKEWLAVKSFELLKQNDISLADCLEFRNLATQLKLEKRGMNVTNIWKKEIAECIVKSNIKDYTLLELSDKNSELNYIEGLENEINYFNYEDDKNNFFNTFDFDKNNPNFLRLLPKNARKAILYNTPIFINVNPFLEHTKQTDNIFNDMKLHGYTDKSLLTIHFAVLFRIIKMCKEYNLTNVKIGFFSYLDMFYENPEYFKFYTMFKEMFKFNNGICFSPKSVGLKDKAELIGYTIWDLKKVGDKNSPVVLEERIQYTDDTILKGSSRLLRGKKDSLYDWVVSGIQKEGDADKVPIFLNVQTKSENTVERYENVLGYLQNTKNLLRSLNKMGVYSVPIGEYTQITYENFFKSIPSYVVRNCLSSNVSLKENPFYLSNPNTEVEGYNIWLADAVIYFTFSPLNMTKSYREKDFDLSNRLFPLSYSEVRRYVTDENIIDDMGKHDAENLKFLQILDSILPSVSPEGKELYNFCINKIKESLKGKNRENMGYKDSLVAWDAGFYQIRGMSKLFTPKEEERYNYLLSVLKDKLSDGIYKYGFISLN